jgi:hypothetical protein
MCEQTKNIAVAREKVFQMFGSEGLQMFDEVVSNVPGTIVIDESRVLFFDQHNNLRFRAGDELPGENE